MRRAKSFKQKRRSVVKRVFMPVSIRWIVCGIIPLIPVFIMR